MPPKVDLIPSNKIGGMVSTAILITGYEEARIIHTEINIIQILSGCNYKNTKISIIIKYLYLI